MEHDAAFHPVPAPAPVSRRRAARARNGETPHQTRSYPLKEIDAEIAEHRQALETATEAVRTQGKAYTDIALAAVGKVRAGDPSTCKGAIERHRRSLKFGYPPDVAEKTDALGTALLRAFGTFDQDAFLAFYAETYPEEMVDLVKIKQSANGKLNAAQDKRKRLLTEASTAIFRDGVLPKKFRTFTSDDPLRLTEEIVTNFVKDFRSRALSFSVPVTISGYSIIDLPEKYRRTWQEAYKRLGLDKATRRAVFAFLKPPAQQETFNGLSAMRG